MTLLTTTAARRALDRIRREQQRDAKHRAALMIHDDTPPEPTGAVEDDRLRLIFTCCHPALAPEARVALTLRLLGGLTVAEIAAAFLPYTRSAVRRSAFPLIVYRTPAPPASVGLLGRRHRPAGRAQLVQPADGVARLVRAVVLPGVLLSGHGDK